MPTLLQIWCGTPPVTLKADIDSASAFAESRGWLYRLDILPECSDPREATILSDQHKFEALSAEPELIYCDIDCALTAEFGEPDFSSLHMGYYPGVSMPTCKAQPDTFLMWGPCDFFKKAISERKAKWSDKPAYCWPRKLLRDREGIVQIPPEWYIHDMRTATTKI